MRINQFLAKAGLGSRRKVEELVLSGRIKCNGKTVTDLGRQIQEDQDKLELDGKPISASEDKRLVALFKPSGYLTSKEDKHHEKTIYDLLNGDAKQFNYAGRLDLTSRGLLLLSGDGDLVQKLTHPRHKLEKEYLVTLQKKTPWRRLVEEFKIGIREGGETLRAKWIEPVFESLEEEETNRFQIILEEGRKRQIRRMFHSKNLSVIDLLRTRIGSLTLDSLNLKEGDFKFIDPNLLFVKAKKKVLAPPKELQR